jgi:hypothetical protein
MICIVLFGANAVATMGYVNRFNSLTFRIAATKKRAVHKAPRVLRF